MKKSGRPAVRACMQIPAELDPRSVRSEPSAEKPHLMQPVSSSSSLRIVHRRAAI